MEDKLTLKYKYCAGYNVIFLRKIIEHDYRAYHLNKKQICRIIQHVYRAYHLDKKQICWILFYFKISLTNLEIGASKNEIKLKWE